MTSWQSCYKYSYVSFSHLINLHINKKPDFPILERIPNVVTTCNQLIHSCSMIHKHLTYHTSMITSYYQFGILCYVLDLMETFLMCGYFWVIIYKWAGTCFNDNIFLTVFRFSWSKWCCKHSEGVSEDEDICASSCDGYPRYLSCWTGSVHCDAFHGQWQSPLVPQETQSRATAIRGWRYWSGINKQFHNHMIAYIGALSNKWENWHIRCLISCNV